MKGPKPKAPKESREEVTNALMRQYLSVDMPNLWVQHVLGYFTTIDLVAIRDEMKKWRP